MNNTNPLFEKVFYWYIALSLGGNGYNFLQHEDVHDHAHEMKQVAEKIRELENKIDTHVIKMEK